MKKGKASSEARKLERLQQAISRNPSLTNAQLAKQFKVSERTIYRWRRTLSEA